MPKRSTVDLDAYPQLAVIYFGLKIKSLRGLWTVFQLGLSIDRAIRARPDGLLRHELLLFGFFHIGMRQYWRDYATMEAWSRSLPHADWWRNFMINPQGIGLWHEIYLRQGGVEGIYNDMPRRLGMSRFAPSQPARGQHFSARGRAGLNGEAQASPVAESDLADE